MLTRFGARLSRVRGLARSRFREILSNLRASGSRYQYAGDSRNFRETWDVCMLDGRQPTLHDFSRKVTRPVREKVTI